MRAGRLDESIGIYSETKTVDPDFGSVKSAHDSLFISTRADVTFANGNETIQNETVTNTQSVDFRIRFRGGIKETMQIEWRGCRYGINSIEVNRRLRFLIIRTSKILN